MKHPLLAKQIAEMVKVDQKIRLSMRPGQKQPNYMAYLVDGIHNQYIRNVIERYGYPTHRLIGKRGMQKFWLLVQHQDLDLELQEGCLQHCDFAPKERAYLTDRVLVHRGKKQFYGTQFKRSPDKKRLVPFPIEKKAEVDRRRRKVGLETLKAYAEGINRRFAERMKKNRKG